MAPNFLNIYYKKKRLANSDIIYKENITSDEKILCIQGQGDLHSFYRFKQVSSSGWCYSQTAWDAITFRPNRTIMVYGFGIYGLTSAYTNFFVKYKYVVMNTASDEIELEVNNDDVD